MLSLPLPRSRPFPFLPGRLLLGALVALLLGTLPGIPRVAPGAPMAAMPPTGVSRSALPISFVPNMGQSDPAVRFQTRAMGGTLFFAPGAVVLLLSGPTANHRTPSADHGWLTRLSAWESALHPPAVPVIRRQPSVVRLHFEGANSAPKIEGAEPLPGKVNYFLGNDPARWRTNVPTYAGIVYRDLYPGIDLRYNGSGGSLKGTYHIAPGSDPTRIRWRYDGASSVRLDETTGDLRISLPSTAHGEGLGERVLIERAPLAWQDIDGRRIPVTVHYVLEEPEVVASQSPISKLQSPSIGFTLGPYDRGRPLTLDPTLVFSTYLGGEGNDYASDIAVDRGGNVYVTGVTYSSDFPAAEGEQGRLGPGGYSDIFIVKLDGDGQRLRYSTYLGGEFYDSSRSLAVDRMGQVYLTGHTRSGAFPLEQPLQKSNKGEWDAFVSKLSASGDALLYSTYLGGSSFVDVGEAITVDETGNAYVTGTTLSTDFPTSRPLQGSNHGIYDAFVAKLDPTGTSLLYSTYLGGSGGDDGTGVVVDPDGSVYVAGTTSSVDFPTANALQPELAGGSDAFAVKLDPEGNHVMYSTYLGGTRDEANFAVASAGHLYLAGSTGSTDFPTRNALQLGSAGQSDAYVAKLSASGAELLFSTYLGGALHDTAMDIAAEGPGRISIVGATSSPDFPTVGALQGDATEEDAFVTLLDTTGGLLLFSTYIGGDGADIASGVAASVGSTIYVAGATTSPDFPTERPLQPAPGTPYYDEDAFVVGINLPPPLSLPLLLR